MPVHNRGHFQTLVCKFRSERCLGHDLISPTGKRWIKVICLMWDRKARTLTQCIHHWFLALFLQRRWEFALWHTQCAFSLPEGKVSYFSSGKGESSDAPFSAATASKAAAPQFSAAVVLQAYKVSARRESRLEFGGFFVSKRFYKFK